LIDGLAILLTVSVLAWALDLYRAVGLVLYTEQFLAGVLGLATALVFLYVPHTGGRRQGPVPWYDALAALVGAGCCFYISIRLPILSTAISMRPWDGMIVAALQSLLLLEGLRRSTGWGMVWTVLFFLAVALWSDLLPSQFAGRDVPFSSLVYFLAWDFTATLGPTLEIVVVVVVAYILFGNVLFRSGGAHYFTGVSMALMGRYRGGPAKIAIVGSSLFGMISGSVVSNVATVGVVTIPLMKQGGYKPHYAAAIEACASTGGQLMPPVMGIAAFIMAEYLQVPYAEVALAAIIPSLLYYGALFIETDIEAVRNGLTRVEESKIPKLWQVLKDGWFFPIPIVVLIGALFWWNKPPETAAMLAIAVILVAAFIFKFEGRRISLGELVEMLRTTGLSMLDLFMIAASAGMVIGLLNISGVGFGLTLSLVHLSGGNLVILLVLAAIVSIILGLGMPTVAVYILLATLIAPALVQMGISPMAAHMFILYFGMLSVITPPVAVAAYAAANLAGADQWKTGWESMRFGWAAFVVPFIFVYSDTLLMMGDPLDVMIDFVTAIGGIWLICMAVMGYSFRPIGIGGRAFYIVAGLALMMPGSFYGFGRWSALIGIAMAAALFLFEFVRKKRLHATARA
jgi:TRAP transporter 4TM/12TM fusion protein